MMTTYSREAYPKQKDYQKEYRKENRELYRESHKKWREKNLEYEKQRQKEYREKNKEKERLRKKKYRADQKLKYNIPDRFGGKTQALTKGMLEEITGLKAQEEVPFEWCRSYKGNIMRVDMYFEELNLIVEYNGQQHYKPIKFGGTMSEAWRKFLRQRKRDELKYKLIKENGYRLLVVPYWEAISINNLTKLLSEVMTSETTEETESSKKRGIYLNKNPRPRTRGNS